MNRTIVAALAAAFALPCAAQPPVKPDLVRAYKRVGTDSLVMHIFWPRDQRPNRAAVALFHGGGFVWGGPEITDGSAKAYAEAGLVAFSVEYRLADRKSVTPLEQVEDTYDAMRWIRAHAGEYGVDPKKVAAHGVSAGGALIGMAAGAADAAVRPNALVMWSPGVGSVRQEDPYLNGLLLGRAQSSDVLPVRHIRTPMPPAIIISGQYDSVTFDGLARQYCERLTSSGARCDFHSYANLGHTLSKRLDAQSQQRGQFDWDATATADADTKVTAFLKSLGYIPAKP